MLLLNFKLLQLTRFNKFVTILQFSKCFPQRSQLYQLHRQLIIQFDPRILVQLLLQIHHFSLTAVILQLNF